MKILLVLAQIGAEMPITFLSNRVIREENKTVFSFAQSGLHLSGVTFIKTVTKLCELVYC